LKLLNESRLRKGFTLKGNLKEEDAGPVVLPDLKGRPAPKQVRTERAKPVQPIKAFKREIFDAKKESFQCSVMSESMNDNSDI
jgi:hypothetical protein